MTRIREPRSIAPHLALVAVQILFGTWPIFGKDRVAIDVDLESRCLPAYRRCTRLRIASTQNHAAPAQCPPKISVLLTLCSMLGVVGNQLLFVKGLSLTTVINATLLSTTIPVFALIVSILFGYDQLVAQTTHRHRSRSKWRGVSRESCTTQICRRKRRQVILLIVTNSLLYATYIVISKNLFERYGALNVITWIFLVGSVVTVPLGIYSMQQENLGAISAGVWLMIVFIIIFPTVGAYYLNAWALTKVAPSTVAIYIYLQPLIAFGFAPFFLGEQWNSRTIIAALLDLCGRGSRHQARTQPRRQRNLRTS